MAAEGTQVEATDQEVESVTGEDSTRTVKCCGIVIKGKKDRKPPGRCGLGHFSSSLCLFSA